MCRCGIGFRCGDVKPWRCRLSSGPPLYNCSACKSAWDRSLLALRVPVNCRRYYCLPTWNQQSLGSGTLDAFRQELEYHLAL